MLQYYILYKSKKSDICFLLFRAKNIHIKHPQVKNLRRIQSSMAYRKLALVFGNNEYESKNLLHNCVNDGEDMANALRSIGFTVTKGINVSCSEMYSLIDEFISKIRSMDMVVFHFSGHGLQWEV